MRIGVGTTIDPGTLVGERWFASTQRPVAGVTVEDVFPFGAGRLAILRVDHVGGSRPVRYTMPIDDPLANPLTIWSGLARLATVGGSMLGDAGGTLLGLPPAGAAAARIAAPEASAAGQSVAHSDARTRVPVVRPLGIDQSHTSVVLDEATILKLYRRLDPGPNPEVELARVLAAAPIPEFQGAIRYVPAAHAGSAPGAAPPSSDIAIVQRYVPGARDEFEVLADALAAWIRAGAPSNRRAGLVADLAPLGRTVAALHAALLRLEAPRVRARAADARHGARWSTAAARRLAAALRATASIDRELAADLRGRRAAIEAALAPLSDVPPGTIVARIHGDLHLGQVIRDGSRFLLGDLEGEPTRSLADRRRPDTPLRDLASMLRSLDHVARSGVRRAAATGPQPAIDRWLLTARRTFLGAYLDDLGKRGVEIQVESRLLHALEVEKELYEFAYAAMYLPAWRYAPAAGLRWLLERGPGAGRAPSE